MEANEASRDARRRQRQVNESNSVIIPDRVIDDNKDDRDGEEEESSVSDNSICGKPKRLVRLSLFVFMLVLVIGIIGATVLGRRRNGKEILPDIQATAQDASVSPSTSPSVSISPSLSVAPSSVPSSNPTLSAMGSFGQVLLPGTDVFALDKESPEYQALEWIVSDKRLGLSPDNTTELLERYALAVFYLSTDGEGWDRNAFWLSAANQCFWEDVDCNDDRDTVTSLQFRRNDLGGTLPTVVGLLVNLEQLEIRNSYGPLRGPIPSEIGDLRSLTSLRLWQTQLSGKLPPTIGKLSRLQNLVLVESLLKGSIPSEIGLLIALRRLVFDNIGEIEGPIPTELGMLSALQHLDFNNMGFTGSIPTHFGLIRGLTSLQLW
mmetsp:Transcript_8770/g.20999  ORF Transcript_8770/g.20999 Transcript_8770/m.20999 type:complete len:377 (+) Transcript_8770:141-1271(+)